MYNKNKNNLDKVHINIALALFLCLDTKDITNILFSKVIKIIASSNEITQTQLIGQLADEMFTVFKHNSNILKLKKDKQLVEDQLNIIKEVRDEIDNTPIEIKMQFGILLFSLLMEEFSYIFKKITLYPAEKIRSHIFILQSLVNI